MREQRNLIRDEERRREQKTGKITGRATPNPSGAYSGGTISMFHKAVERRENERAAREAAASGDAEGALPLLDASSPNMSPSGHSRRRSGGKVALSKQGRRLTEEEERAAQLDLSCGGLWWRQWYSCASAAWLAERR